MSISGLERCPRFGKRVFTPWSGSVRYAKNKPTNILYCARYIRSSYGFCQHKYTLLCQVNLWPDKDNPGYFPPILALFWAISDCLGLNPGYLPPMHRHIDMYHLHPPVALLHFVQTYILYCGRKPEALINSVNTNILYGARYTWSSSLMLTQIFCTLPGFS